MKIKNPARHLPHYAIRVHLPDGTLFNKRGSAQPEIDVPVKEDEYLALVFECFDNGQKSQVKLLRVAGAWVDFSAERLAEMLNPVPDPVSPTPEETQRYESQSKGIEWGPEEGMLGPDILSPGDTLPRKPEQKPEQTPEQKPEQKPEAKPEAKPVKRPVVKRVGRNPANAFEAPLHRRPTN